MDAWKALFSTIGLGLALTGCMVEDGEFAGRGDDGTYKGGIIGTADPKGPGQGGDSAKVPQAGQLTAGEIDDRLNFPAFKDYLQRTLQQTGMPRIEYALPDQADVKDRFAGASRPKVLDLAFAIDATGSMGDEMAYLAVEFQGIVGRVMARHPDLDLRFGLVFYRDQGDEFLVKSHAFRSSAPDIQAILKAQGAGGGGDTPEAMDAGLEAALDLAWREGPGTARMLFLVADAPPHESGVRAYLDAVAQAEAKGVRIYPLAASSTDEATELLMRVAAFETGGSYSFLTDDSGIGNAHKEPSIPCYLVTRLDELLTRLIESEIAGVRLEPEPAAIIREAGNYEKGRCSVSQIPPSL